MKVQMAARLSQMLQSQAHQEGAGLQLTQLAQAASAQRVQKVAQGAQAKAGASQMVQVTAHQLSQAKTAQAQKAK